MLISQLAEALLERFPAASAESWDHVGLSAGNPAEEVTGVLCALDATEANVVTAAETGANVLLTHHPVYIKAPDAFVPAQSSSPSASATVYEAIRRGVTIISLHTNLDRSREARELLPQLMGYTAKTSLEHAGDPDALGLGSLCDIEPTTVAALAAHAAKAFDSEPRVWGNPDAPVTRLAYLGGSLGEFGEYALQEGAQAIICGEAGYHICQDLSLRGLAVILLGHDRSEQSFVEILAKAATEAGIDPALVHKIKPSHQWWTYTKGDCS